jgi:hypothetical protein
VVDRRHLNSLAQPHRATARSVDAKRRVWHNEATAAECSRSRNVAPGEVHAGNCDAETKGSWESQIERQRQHHSSFPHQILLTVKLRGRTTTPDRRRGRTLSCCARGAKQTTPHGPLQRLLGAE